MYPTTNKYIVYQEFFTKEIYFANFTNPGALVLKVYMIQQGVEMF